MAAVKWFLIKVMLNMNRKTYIQQYKFLNITYYQQLKIILLDLIKGELSFEKQ